MDNPVFVNPHLWIVKGSLFPKPKKSTYTLWIKKNKTYRALNFFESMYFSKYLTKIL